MPGKRHARRGISAAAVILASLCAGAAPAAATDNDNGGVHKSSAQSARAQRAERRLQMPGWSARHRDQLAIDAAAALNYVMRQDNTDDPGYRAARRRVSDGVAKRMGLDPVLLDRKWSKAPRDHQIAGLAAITQINVPYVEGREDAYVQMDCSGLQWYSWRVAGLDMPRQAVSQQDRHMRIERADARWGDIVGEGTHVHMYLGLGNAMIHAPFNGKRVKFKMMSEAQAQRSVWADPSLIALYRL